MCMQENLRVAHVCGQRARYLGLASLQGSLVSAAWPLKYGGHQELSGAFMLFDIS